MNEAISSGSILILRSGRKSEKIRPAVVVSNNVNNRYSPIVSIAPITSNVTKVYAFEVEIPAGVSGLTKTSKIMINQTRAVDSSRLVERIGKLPPEYIPRLDTALRIHFALDLP